jgi:hypothetical protein
LQNARHETRFRESLRCRLQRSADLEGPSRRQDPRDGYYVYRSGTNNVFIFLRAFYQDPKNLKPPVDLIEKARIYPFVDEASAKPMTFPNASGVPADMLPISDGSVFDVLKQLVDAEGDDLAGPDGLAMLAAIGIVKDQSSRRMPTHSRFSIAPRRPPTR